MTGKNVHSDAQLYKLSREKGWDYVSAHWLAQVKVLTSNHVPRKNMRMRKSLNSPEMWAAAGAGIGGAPPIWWKPQAVTTYHWDGKEWRLNKFSQSILNTIEKIPWVNRKKQGAHHRETPTRLPGWKWDQREGVHRKNWSGNHENALLMEKSKSTSTSECKSKRDAESEWRKRRQVAGGKK